MEHMMRALTLSITKQLEGMGNICIWATTLHKVSTYLLFLPYDTIQKTEGSISYLISFQNKMEHFARYLLEIRACPGMQDQIITLDNPNRRAYYLLTTLNLVSKH